MQPTLAIGVRGLAVARLHQQLAERGVLPPGAASEVAEQTFGEVTAGAVATFQAQHGLAPDGIVGPRTWDALTVGVDQHETDPLLLGEADHAGPFGRAALLVAKGELGVQEDPPGSNRGPRVDAYLVGLAEDAPYLLHHQRNDRAPQGWAGAPWCGRFVRWCFDRGAQQLGVRSPIAGWGDLASALKWRDQARLHRCWVETPAPGRVGLHLNDDGHGHVTLVARLDGQVITTIAGNESNEVAVRQRPPEYFTGGFVEMG